MRVPFLKPLAKTGSCRFIGMCMCVCVWVFLYVNTVHTIPQRPLPYYIQHLPLLSPHLHPVAYIIHAFLLESCKNEMAPGGHHRPWHSVQRAPPSRSFLRTRTNIVQFFVDFIRRVLQINGMRKLCQVQRFCFRVCLISFRPDLGEIVTLLKIW